MRARLAEIKRPDVWTRTETGDVQVVMGRPLRQDVNKLLQGDQLTIIESAQD